MLVINPAISRVIAFAWIPFEVVSIELVAADQPGGWLADDREYKTAKRRAKIKAKRERRQEYVMRKIWNELQGITDPDEYLLALMAEFEGVEEVLLSPAQQQDLLNKAYYDYIIVRLEAQAAQDKEDEDAIMFSLAELI